ncbi:hypothetical protein HK096_007193 [Nowakowskiella sp. JEL0078]|nr:hypothetical protein HK096_007193 [Nowakowskiella sp. JEL0078]
MNSTGMEQNQAELEQYLVQYMQMVAEQNNMFDQNLNSVSCEFFKSEVGSVTGLSMADTNSGSGANFQLENYPTLTTYLDFIPTTIQEQYPLFDMSPNIDFSQTGSDFLPVNSQSRVSQPDLGGNVNSGFRKILPRHQDKRNSNAAQMQSLSLETNPQNFSELKNFNDLSSRHLTNITSMSSLPTEFSGHKTQPSQMSQIPGPIAPFHFLTESATNIPNQGINHELDHHQTFLSDTTTEQRNDIKSRKAKQASRRATQLANTVDVDFDDELESEGDDQDSDSATRSHKHAEQRRRNALKTKFQELIAVLPPHRVTRNGIEEGAGPVIGTKMRKAPPNRTHVLEFTNRYIQRMNGRFEELQVREDSLMEEVRELKSELEGLKTRTLV